LIAENSGDFIAVLDLEGSDALYNSPSYKQFFGDPRYLMGTDSFTEVHPDDRERVRRVFFRHREVRHRPPRSSSALCCRTAACARWNRAAE
jgi:PAS domain S-box-containing protein